MTAVALDHGAGVAGVALQPPVADDGMFRGSGDDRGSMESTALLPLNPDLAVLDENIGKTPSLAGEDCLHAGAERRPVVSGLPERLIVFPINLPPPGGLRAAVTILAADLGLEVHVGVGVAIPHDVP